MAEKIKLHRPWLVAIWPGMGHVALNAGYYLLAKLDRRYWLNWRPAICSTSITSRKEGMVQPPASPAIASNGLDRPEQKARSRCLRQET